MLCLPVWPVCCRRYIARCVVVQSIFSSINTPRHQRRSCGTGRHRSTSCGAFLTHRDTSDRGRRCFDLPFSAHSVHAAWGAQRSVFALISHRFDLPSPCRPSVSHVCRCSRELGVLFLPLAALAVCPDGWIESPASAASDSRCFRVPSRRSILLFSCVEICKEHEGIPGCIISGDESNLVTLEFARPGEISSPDPLRLGLYTRKYTNWGSPPRFGNAT